MAEIQQLDTLYIDPFGDAKTREGSVEQDRFIINDIPLRIPPTQISIDKRSFNKEWYTLRTVAPQKLKSGHSILQIDLDVVFRGNNDINRHLIPLVAGLRATPFCTVRNHYLSNVLQGQEDAGAFDHLEDVHKKFKPIGLAINHMSFTTVPSHPDCIQAHFSFLWFNYFPYTPIWAYKTGGGYNTPGFPWQSDLWRAFYQPFVENTKPIDWPHKEGTPTVLRYRVFDMLPRGTSLSNQAALDLVQTLKKRPTTTLKALNEVLNSGNPDVLDQGVYDALYRKLVKEGENTNGDLREKISSGSLGAQSVTSAVSGVFGDVLKKINQTRNGSNNTKSDGDLVRLNEESINNAISVLKGRIKKLQKLESQGQINAVGKEAEGFTLLQEVESKYGTSGEEASVGGLSLIGAKKSLAINSVDKRSPDNHTSILTAITVEFSNILAMIPMVGYRYPTAQHIGSVSSSVSISLNCNTRATSDIHKVYDTVDSMALRFKQVPSGFLNLWVENDFLGLFGLKEFITENISTETIPGQPGRSSILLQLTEPGVNSTTKLNDPDINNPETIRQEFVQTSESISKSIEKVLLRYLNEEGLKGNQGNKDNERDGFDRHKLEIKGVVSKGKNAALYKLVEEYRNNYNGLLKKVHRAVFNGDAGDGANSAIAFNELESITPPFGFIPSVERIQKSLNRRHYEFTTSNPRRAHNNRVEKDRHHSTKAFGKKETLKRIAKAFGAVGKGPLSGQPDNVEIIKDRKQRLSDMGVPEYIHSQKSLFLKIQEKFLLLEEFVHIKQQEEAQGLGKGISAYSDFRKQIKSIASIFENERDLGESTLLRYEPDVYMWYPVYDGGHNSDLSNIIDLKYINEAKRLSSRSFEKAQGKVNDFFQGTYRRLLKGDDSWKVPHDILTKNLEKGNREVDSGGKRGIVLPYYDKISFRNSSHEEAINKTVTTDPFQKSPTNFYIDQSRLSISGKSSCRHTTDFNEYLSGVGSSTADAPPPPTGSDSPPNKQYDPNSPSMAKRSTAPVNKSDAPVFGWPTSIPTRFSKGYIWGASRSYRGAGQKHTGLDLGASIQGQTGEGEPVFAAADGTIKVVSVGRDDRPGGNLVYIRHQNNWQTRYFHMWERDIKRFGLRVGQKVRKGQQIGVVGRSGIKRSAAHLHFEIRKGRSFKTDNQRSPAVDPLEMLPGGEQFFKATMGGRTVPNKFRRRAQQSLGTGVTANVSSPLDQSINEYQQDLLNGQGQTLRRAYPTFKLYFIEDDSSERRLAFDDFFSYNSVKSIRVVRSRKIAADLCYLELTNISGTLSNRKFRHQLGGDKPLGSNGKPLSETTSAMNAGTIKENPIASLLLQEGINISLRLGYSNDPDRLETVFNGVLTDVQFSDSDDMVRILAQSHAIELVQDIKGIEKPKENTSIGLFGWDFWGFGQDASTARILENMIAEPEVLHFGRWSPNKPSAGTPQRELLTNKWQWSPNPSDDNIFAPPASLDLSLGTGLIIDELKYIIYRTTVWDIFQEMTLRHPNFVASPVPYKSKGSERMTMFFGLPNQLYFARDTNVTEEIKQERLKNVIKDVENNQAGAEKKLRAKLGYYGSVNAELAKKDNKETRNIKQLRAQVAALKNDRLKLAKTDGYIKPFRSYHLFTSKQHIIANNIKANSRDVANTIVIKYPGEPVKVPTPGGFSSVSMKGQEKTFTLKLDSALPTEEIRTQMGQFVNVTNDELAKRYALGLLMRNLKDTYKGALTVIGAPRVKPYDVAYIFDEYTDMVGPIEVEQVVHIFDQENGFRTEIKPDMLVQAAEWSLVSSCDAMGMVMEGAVRNAFGKRSSAFKFFVGDPYIIGAGISIFGGFIAQKILNYTQLGQPIVMSPLKHRGRIFSGGVPTRKIPTSIWNTVLGEWSPAADDGFPMWWEDKKSEWMNALKKGVGGFVQGGNFWTNDNTVNAK